MLKMSKKLYIAIVVVLCIGIAFMVCITHSDAEEKGQEKVQTIPPRVSQEDKGKGEDSYNTNQIVSKETENNEKEGDYQEDRDSKVTVVSESPKDKAESQPTQEVSKHTHSWEPVHSVKTDYETVDVYGVRCNNCGYSTTVADDLYDHIDKDPFDQCGSYSTGVVIRTEQHEVEEKYISGYKCSCGAKK